MKFCVNCVHLQPGNLCTSPQRPADMVTGSQLPMDAKKLRTDPKMCAESAFWFARKHKEMEPDKAEPDKKEQPTEKEAKPYVYGTLPWQSGYGSVDPLKLPQQLRQFNTDDIAKAAQQMGEVHKKAAADWEKTTKEFTESWNANLKPVAPPMQSVMKGAWANPYPAPADSIKDQAAGFRPDMKGLMDKMLNAQREFLAGLFPKE